MKMVIYRGPAGCGKTTSAKALQAAGYAYASADTYFTREDGQYVFSPSGLGPAHAQCFRTAVEACLTGCPVVVDNTNTTVAEMAPYYLLAKAYGYEVAIHDMTPGVMFHDTIDTFAARNVHGVPKSAITAQMRRLAENPVPRHWECEVIWG